MYRTKRKKYEPPSPETEALVESMDFMHVGISTGYRELFRKIVEAKDRDDWEAYGARDLTHFLVMRFGISTWKANRWIHAADALERLPRLAEALSCGRLGIDKVVELCRFATPETEERLIGWATTVSCTHIRKKGDLEARRALAEIEQIDRERRLEYYLYDENRRLHGEFDLPAAEGMKFVKAVERRAEQIPEMPGEEGDRSKRLADALVSMAAGAIASDPDPDRATVVVHASVEQLARLGGSVGIERGRGVIHIETARRLACSARLHAVVEASDGTPIGYGRTRRDPTAKMLQRLWERDGGCTFPGCGTTQHVEAHHVPPWEDGGLTDIDKMALICSFHHKLLHEYGWWLVWDGSRRRWIWYQPGALPYTGVPPALEFAPDPDWDDAMTLAEIFR